MTTISEKQLEANQLNARLGGVKTNEGKQVVRFNARKHGILGNLVADYEDNFYTNYLEQLFEEFQPSSMIENILVERIALYYLKLYRLTKAESEFLLSSLNPTIHKSFFNEDSEIGYIPIVNATHMQQLLEIYSRYETAIENRLYKAIQQLKKYKAPSI